jgi:hypothetical protein
MALLEWQNLIFVLPMGLGVLYVLLMATGLAMGEHGDVDVDHDIGTDHDLDVDHDIGVEHDVGVDHDVADGHDVHAGHAVPDSHVGSIHGHQSSLLGRALGVLGVGKVPISILMISALFIWGAVGLVLNAFMGLDAIGRVAGLTALASVVGTRLVAEGLASILPGEESYHTPKDQLIGEVGEVLYEVTPTAGTVRLRDPSGNLVDLDCRAYGEDRFPAGSRVVLQEYASNSDSFLVRAEV